MAENNIRHTFAVMAYGDSPYIEECIRSLKTQTVQSRIIITTSTPNSRTERLAEKYGLELFVNDAEPGIASDWEFAASCCDTELFTLAHQDDVYYKDYTKELLPLMEKSSIGYTGYEELVGESTRSGTKMLLIKQMLLFPHIFKKTLYSRFMKKLVLRLGSPICCPSVMYNRKYVGKLTFDHSLKTNLDWAKWLELSQKDGGFSHVRKILMAHRIHESSETSVQLAGNARQSEDAAMFGQLWCRPIARVLTKMYSGSYKSNSRR